MVSEPIILVCNAACTCAAELANLRRIWGRYFVRKAADDCIDMQDGGLSVLAASISRLMYDLKLLKDSFPAVAWPLRAVSSLPPPTVAGTRDATSYHDTAFDMANAFLHHFAAFTQCGLEILHLVDGPAVPPGDLDRIFANPSLSELRNKIAQKVRFILRNPLISSGLYGFMDSVQEFDADALIARIQHEAARALATSSIQSQELANSESRGCERNDGASVTPPGIRPDEGQEKDNVNSAPPAPNQAIGLPKQPEENIPERLPRTDVDADSVKHALAESHEAAGGRAAGGDSAASWYHESHEPRPADYKHGPLTGTKREISRWMGGPETKTPRRMEQKAKLGIVWVIRLGETSWEVWFKDEKIWEIADRTRRFG